MSRSADLYREDLGGIDEGGGIGSELSEEVAEAVDEHKGPDEFLYVGNEREQTEGDSHHAKAQVLNRFAAEFIHGEGGDRITGCGESGEDTELGEGFLQQRVVASQSGEDERARYSVAVVSEVHEEPGCTGSE